MRYFESAQAQSETSVIADERHVDAAGVERLADLHDRPRRFGRVDGEANELGAGFGERRHLFDGRVDLSRGRVRHRLHDDGTAAADRDDAFAVANGHEVRNAPTRGAMKNLLGHAETQWITNRATPRCVTPPRS